MPGAGDPAAYPVLPPIASFPRRAHWQRYSALLGNLPDDRVHQATRLTGLEVRFPFFDPGVRSLVESLDQGLRFLPGEPKRVLKAALARRVPRSLWDVPKHGFDFPFADLLAAQRFALVREYLDPARVSASGPVGPRAGAPGRPRASWPGAAATPSRSGPWWSCLPGWMGITGGYSG